MTPLSLSPPASWPDAILVASIFACDPLTLKGICVRGPSGPARDAWLKFLTDLLPIETAIRRCPARIDEDRLIGGLDLAASLASGTSVLQRGLLSESDGGVVIFAMADTLPTGIGAQIAHVLDQGQVNIARDGVDTVQSAHIAMVLLDEGASDDERPPGALIERCAFHLDSRELTPFNSNAKTTNAFPTRADIAAAKLLLRSCTEVGDDVIEGLTKTALAFGINSFRPLLFTLRVAQIAAALAERTCVTFDDAALAARLVLSPKATRIPESEADTPPDTQTETESSDPPPPDQTPHDQPSDNSHPKDTTQPLSDAPALTAEMSSEDMLVEIVKAALPAHLIAALLTTDRAMQRGRDRDGRGSGDSVASAKRGRPIGSRRGAMRSGQRIHLMDTLRAAAPWQKLRQSELSQSDQNQTRVHVRREDIRIRRFIEKRETTIVFAVDASGSSAWQRLAEAKGVVQLMLARAYQTRSRVALITFRQSKAELILPPTRSLTRARRLLADMVAGGGTPLASGIEAALTLALSEKAKGRTPRLLILTDGQGNIARDGTPGRPKANADALNMASQVRISGIDTIQIDTATRLRPESRELAARMGAKYISLPQGRALIGELDI